ncbi:neuropeptide CCHamide 1 [Xylocopa sonorina]|uniref:neuropeptide CCHamide 1 n=1 Tax=Xylocopa sonorina TaxID=1818115 RepID=UPI00403AEF92
MAIASENSVTIIIRTWIFMIIFCFAGCAAGSCLSYGHSCWGAHGKRSGAHNNAYLVPSKTLNDIQQDIPSLTKEQLILSRLVGRPLTSNKYKGRWDRFFKIKMNFPEHFDDDELNAHLSDVSIRDQNNNEGMDEEKRRRTSNARDVMESIDDDRKQIPEILLVSNNEDSQHGSKPQNVELFKFLSDVNGNFE